MIGRALGAAAATCVHPLLVDWRNYRLRLLELGFHPGESVRCVQAPALGAPRVYQVANVTFSLDDDIAGCVHVVQVHDD